MVTSSIGSINRLNPLVRVTAPGAKDSIPPTSSSDVEQAFLEEARKTPAERLRDQILKELGLTQEGLDQLSPEARQAVGEEIAKRVKEALTRDDVTAGAVVDKSA